ncbi:MAG: alpha/beta hydrolase [Gammaproteobacteria bacterium]
MFAYAASVMAVETENGRDGFSTVGMVSKRTLGDATRQPYFLYVPQRGGANAPVFVTVHGISRNAREHAERFASFAERYGAVLIAPYFSKGRFPDYQRLGRKGKGERADLALDRIVDEVGRLTGAQTGKLFLFGYSGGAQFVHRYTLAHPERVAKVVLGAPGWYTFPDPTVKYPKGIAQAKSLPGVTFDPSGFLAIPTCVLVGERDVRQDVALNKSPKIAQQQGPTRLERGEHWIAAMTRAAEAQGLKTSYTFHTLPRSRHSFTQSMRRGKMGEMVFDCLFGGGK